MTTRLMSAAAGIAGFLLVLIAGAKAAAAADCVSTPSQQRFLVEGIGERKYTSAGSGDVYDLAPQCAHVELREENGKTIYRVVLEAPIAASKQHVWSAAGDHWKLRVNVTLPSGVILGNPRQVTSTPADTSGRHDLLGFDMEPVGGVDYYKPQGSQAPAPTSDQDMLLDGAEPPAGLDPRGLSAGDFVTLTIREAVMVGGVKSSRSYSVTVSLSGTGCPDVSVRVPGSADHDLTAGRHWDAEPYVRDGVTCDDRGYREEVVAGQHSLTGFDMEPVP